MSRSKLSNTELKFYNTSGEADVIHAKMKGTTADSIIFEGSSSATKVKLKNVQDPTQTGEVATWDYVNTKVNELSNGLSWKAPVKAKTTENINGSLVGNVFTCISNAQQTLDGVLIALNDRVLLSNQTNQIENGLYFCSTEGNARSGLEEQAVFTRTSDGDTADELKACAVFVEQGSTQADTAYVQTTDALVLGTSNIVFAQFSSSGETLAGQGLSKTGNTFAVEVDNATLEIEAGSLVVKDLGINADKVATNTLTGNQIQDASLTDVELADNACVSRVINSSAVVERCVANGAITESKLSASPPAVGSDTIQSDAITTVKILDSNITEAKLANSACTSEKISTSAILNSHLSLGCVQQNSIGDAQISSQKCIDGFCTSQKLASQAVVSSKIALSNILTSHIAPNQITSSLIASNQIDNTHLKINAVEEDSVLDGAITESKLANNSVTLSKLGTLTGSLTVNGLINATGFVASGSGSESDGGFALPKAKSLSINFTTDQSISTNYSTVGTDSNLSAVSFSNDDAITMAMATSVFRVNHLGTNGSVISAVYEISYYNGAGVAQSYNDVSTQTRTFEMYSPNAQDYLLGHQATLGDGATRIAGIRMRLKHSVSADTVVVTDSLQTTCLAIDDTSGNVNRTFSSGVIS